jgi:hypothetical protein
VYLSSRELEKAGVSSHKLAYARVSLRYFLKFINDQQFIFHFLCLMHICLSTPETIHFLIQSVLYRAWNSSDIVHPILRHLKVKYSNQIQCFIHSKGIIYSVFELLCVFIILEKQVLIEQSYCYTTWNVLI